MIYTLIELALFSLCIYLLFKVINGLFAEPELVQTDIPKDKVRALYKEEFGAELTDEQIKEGMELAAKKYAFSPLSATLCQLTFLPIVVVIITVVMSLNCTNYYWDVTKIYTTYIFVSSVVLAVAFFMIGIFFLKNDKTYKLLPTVISVVLVAYLYFFLSFLSVCIGNLLYRGQEEVLSHRVERSRFTTGKKGARTYYLVTSPVDDSMTRLNPITDDQIPVPDRYMLVFAKHCFAPIIQHFEAPAVQFDIEVPGDFFERRCKGNSDELILEAIDKAFPQGSLIGVKARKSYFGEVMAKNGFEDLVKITVDENGKQSYSSLD